MHNFYKLIFFCCIIFSNPIQGKEKSQEENAVHPIDILSSELFFLDFYINTLDTNHIKAYLISAIQKKYDFTANLVLDYYNESPAMWHFHFNIEKDGDIIYRNFVKINIQKSNYKTKSWSILYFAEDKKVENNISYLPFQQENLREIKSEKVWFPTENGLQLCQRIELANDIDIHFEEIYHPNGNFLYRNHLIAHFKSFMEIDTTALLSVFNPDPLTTANQLYGAPYVHGNNTDIPELNAEIQWQEMMVKLANDTFYLENDWVKITDHSLPNHPVTTSPTDSFLFTRAMYQFEEVNAYYHLTNYQLYMQSLGYQLVNYQIHADAHALNGADNSNFTTSSNPPRLNFGDGGVPDAEDADVIVHEYGHAISHSAAPGSNVGLERRSVDEALGDYLAASYSKALELFGSERVFNWDGHNEFWPGRVVNTQKMYPGDLTGSIHRNGEIFSTAVMNIHDEIGRETTDKILLQSLYGYFPNMNMRQAAQLFLQADTILNQNQNSETACEKFEERGLLDCEPNAITENNLNTLKILNSQNFGQQNVTIMFEKNMDGKIVLYDFSGKIIVEENFQNQNQVELKANSEWSAGFYILSVQSVNGVRNFKLIKGN